MMKTYKIIQSVIISLLLLLSTTAISQQKTNPKNQDEELGMVSWYRDYDTALSLSKEKDKPVLILFQEVPGCATCRNYGHDVLSNPLMTEAITNEFIPLAIFNNKGGDDAKVLKKYKEPSWNNPVVRIVNKTGDDLVRRVASDYSAKGLYDAMVDALNKSEKEIPGYMKLLGAELLANKDVTKDTYYSMYCFWTGEKQLGSQEGVLNTEAGFMKGREVVKVTYNPEIIADNSLISFAQQHKMSPIGKDTSYRASAKDEDYYLQHSPYKYIPLSPLQRTKINAALGNGQSATQFLSPKQLQWLKVKNTEVVFNNDFHMAWEKRTAVN